jgi:hypothetical protein
MNAVVGEVLPLAVGIAVSPIPIVAAILMLLSPRARSTSVGFLLGWVLGIVVAVVVFTALSSVLPGEEADDSQPLLGAIQVALGVLLLLVASGVDGPRTGRRRRCRRGCARSTA